MLLSDYSKACRKTATRRSKLQQDAAPAVVLEQYPDGTYPFEVVRMDSLVILRGDPVKGESKVYAVTLMCSYSRYCLVKVLLRPPTSADTAALLRLVLNCFNTTPGGVATDHGSEFDGEFTRTLRDLNVIRLPHACYSSWLQGKLERIHSTINDRVRACLQEYSTFNLEDLVRIIERAVQVYNTTVHDAIRATPHSMIFTFPSWIYPKLNEYRPLSRLYWAGSLVAVPDEEERLKESVENSAKMPKAGELWFVRRFDRMAKIDPVYWPCTILVEVDSRMWLVLVNDTKTVVHRKNLRWAHETAFQQFSSRGRRLERGPLSHIEFSRLVEEYQSEIKDLAPRMLAEHLTTAMRRPRSDRALPDIQSDSYLHPQLPSRMVTRVSGEV